jgi:hypothetical protein
MSQGEMGEKLSVTFSASAPGAMPAALDDPTIEHHAADEYCIRASSRSWLIRASAVHLHLEVARAFYEVIKPRVPPWQKRVLWRLVLALAASPLFRLLRLLRR